MKIKFKKGHIDSFDHQSSDFFIEIINRTVYYIQEEEQLYQQIKSKLKQKNGLSELISVSVFNLQQEIDSDSQFHIYDYLWRNHNCKTKEQVYQLLFLWYFYCYLWYMYYNLIAFWYDIEVHNQDHLKRYVHSILHTKSKTWLDDWRMYYNTKVIQCYYHKYPLSYFTIYHKITKQTHSHLYFKLEADCLKIWKDICFMISASERWADNVIDFILLAYTELEDKKIEN